MELSVFSKKSKLLLLDLISEICNSNFKNFVGYETPK
jgi:hypothetical protein